MNSPLARNIVRTFSTEVGSQIISVLAGIIIARAIGPTGKGFVSYGITAVALVSVFFNGFGDAVIFQFGKQNQPARAVHRAALRTLIVILAAIIPILVGIAVVVPSQRPLAMTAAILPFAIYIQLMTPFLMVRDKIALVNIRTVAQNFGTAAVTVSLIVFAHLGLPVVVAVSILFYAVAAIFSGWGLRPILAASPPVEEASADLGREQLRFGLRAAGASAAGFLNVRIAFFVVSIMFSPAALGCYALAVACGEMLWQVSRAFVWSALGRIGSYSLSDSAALVARITRNTLAIVSSLGVFAFVAGPWLIVHVYGQNFAPSGSALRWALPGLIAYAAEVALTNFIILQLGKPITIVWIQSISAIVCAGLTFATAGRFGISGAAGSTSVTFLIVTAALIVMFVRATGMPVQRLLIIQREDLRFYSALIHGLLRSLRLRPTKTVSAGRAPGEQEAANGPTAGYPNAHDAREAAHHEPTASVGAQTSERNERVSRRPARFLRDE